MNEHDSIIPPAGSVVGDTATKRGTTYVPTTYYLAIRRSWKFGIMKQSSILPNMSALARL